MDGGKGLLEYLSVPGVRKHCRIHQPGSITTASGYSSVSLAMPIHDLLWVVEGSRILNLD
jgi:hypothetical protein